MADWPPSPRVVPPSGYRDDVVTIKRELWDIISTALVISGGHLMTITGVVDHPLTDEQVDDLVRLGLDEE